MLNNTSDTPGSTSEHSLPGTKRSFQATEKFYLSEVENRFIPSLKKKKKATHYKHDCCNYCTDLIQGCKSQEKP